MVGGGESAHYDRIAITMIVSREMDDRWMTRLNYSWLAFALSRNFLRDI